MLLVLTTLLAVAPPTAPTTTTLAPPATASTATASTTTASTTTTPPATASTTTAPTATAPTRFGRSAAEFINTFKPLAGRQGFELLAVVGGEIEFLELPPIGVHASDDAEVSRAIASGMKAELWMLPSTAAARRVTPTRATPQVWNDCGGDNGIAVGTAEFIDAVVAAHGAPPPSWHKPVTSWTEQQLTTAEQRVRAQACGTKDCSIGVVGTVGLGGFARVVRSLPNGAADDELQTFEVVDVVLDGAGAIVEKWERTERDFSAPDKMPVALRDVVGDAAPEVILRNGCSTEVRTLDGTTLFSSVQRCCGC